MSTWRRGTAGCVWAAAILCAQQPAPRQEVRVSSHAYVPPPPYVLRVETSLVETGVVVRNHDGRPVGGFTRDDFKIFDDGKEREITAFSVERAMRGGARAAAGGSPAAAREPGPAAVKIAAPPRFVALLFDDVHTNQGDLSHAKLAAARFVKEAMQPGDRVAILTISGTVTLSYTADAATLVEAIGKLRAHPRMDENGVMPCPRITPYQAYLIVMMDPTATEAAVLEAEKCAEAAPTAPTLMLVRAQAEQTWDQARLITQQTLDMVQAMVDNLAKAPGTRVLLLASAGFLAGTLEYEQNRIIDRALKAGVVVNALDAKGEYANTAARTPDQMMYLTALPMRTAIFEATSQTTQLQEIASPLAYLAQSTGGLYFHDSNDLAAGFARLAAVPEVAYRLGFQPGDLHAGRYHKLTVKLTRKTDYVVQARRGYFAPKEDDASAPPVDPRQRLDREVTGSDVVADFPARIAVEPGKSTRGAPLLWVTVHVDLQKLPFTERDARHAQQITFVTALLDTQGRLVAAKQGRMDLDLTEPTYARLSQSGVNAKLSLEAAPGVYRLREVVEEAGGKMATLSQAVEIR